LGKNRYFWPGSRRVAILTAGIHLVFRGFICQSSVVDSSAKVWWRIHLPKFGGGLKFEPVEDPAHREHRNCAKKSFLT